MNYTSNMGGAVYSWLGLSIRWNGHTIIFAFNTALMLSWGAVAIFDSSLPWSGRTKFERNRSISSGGALYVHIFDESWEGNTEFVSIATLGVLGPEGAMKVMFSANVSWTGVT